MLAKILSLAIAAAGIACPAWFLWHAMRGLPRLIAQGVAQWSPRPFLITLAWCLGIGLLCLLVRSVDLWIMYLVAAPCALGISLLPIYRR